MKSPRTATTVSVVLLFVAAAGVGSAFVLDVDGDEIPAYEEFGATDPLSGDTDGDGLDDAEGATFGSDPTKADTDGDGVDDQSEYWGVRGYSSGVQTDENNIEWKRSDPTDTDTDGDGIDDGTEVEKGMDPTSDDSDDDGLSDSREFDGATDPASPDTDGDNLADGWEIRGESDEGADLSDADPLHKDMFVHVAYLRGAERELPSGVFADVESWYARMPVRNPDGETGITVHFTDGQRVDRSIDEWERDDGSTTAGVSGFMAMREFYNRETIGEKTGSHFLVVVAGPDVPVRGSGNAGGSKTSIVTPWPGSDHGDERRAARTITHELLHNVVREVGGNDCNGRMHTCEGFLSYENDYYLSEAAKNKINEQGFAPPVYREQMNATNCEATMAYPDECGA